MESDRLITVAIHTYEFAIALKHILQAEGIEVTLQNVNLSEPIVSAGIRVRIYERDLPLALRIIESVDVPSSISKGDTDLDTILVPIDFSERSFMAAGMAFYLAYAHKKSVVLLHSFCHPLSITAAKLSSAMTFDFDSKTSKDRVDLMREARSKMDSFVTRLKRLSKQGELPPVSYSTEIREGVPEDAINRYSKEHQPFLIVMGTRKADSKTQQSLGSVTAEVLDTCRIPVISLPENDNHEFPTTTIKTIVYFTSFDQEDLIALDLMFHLLPVTRQVFDVKFVEVTNKRTEEENASARNALLKYCRKNYPIHQFSIEPVSISNIDNEFPAMLSRVNAELIAVPNKKKNIFARLFNPGLAHRLLFSTDIPMMVLPV